MRVFIIGGTRFLGHHIVAAFLKEGHEVTLFHRGKHTPEFEGSVQVHIGDRHDSTALRNAVGTKSYHVVVDTICYDEADARQDVEIFQDRCEHFFFISTASVYLLRQGTLPPFREEDGYLEPPDDLAHAEKYHYGLHKRKADLYFLQAFQASQFPATVLRLPVVVGPRDYTGRLYAYYHRLQQNLPILLPDGGHNGWGFVWVEDVAKFITTYSQDKRVIGKALNIAQRELVTLRDLVLALGEITSSKPYLVDIPTHFLMRYPITTTFSPFYGSEHVFLSLSRTEALGFQPTPFWSWLSRWVQYIRQSPQKDLYASTLEQEAQIVKDYQSLFKTRR